MPVHPYGDRALLVDLPDLAQVHATAAALRRDPPAGLVDLVPAARSVLLTFTGPRDAAAARPAVVAAVHAPLPDPSDVPLVRVPAVYDGEDLAAVAAATGLSVAEVVERHARVEYVVSFVGFAPGFAYLGPLDPTLRLPRRATPRTRVPAGSVAIAEDSTAVYPTASPGGWHLIGRTDLRLFDPDADPPALLVAGTRVRFVPGAPR